MAASFRCPQSLLIMMCWACCSLASTAAHSAATRSPVLSVWRLCGCSRPGNTRSEPPGSAVRMRERLDSMIGRGVISVRSRGLWAGVDIDPRLGTGRDVCEALARRHVLAKDTHGSTIRLAPPLVISEDQLQRGLDQLELALSDLS